MFMWRAAKIASVIGFLALGFLVWAATQAQFTFQHPKARDLKVVVTNSGAQLALNVAERQSRPAEVQRPKESPRLSVAVKKHDFGYMDPLARGSHSFIVKNEGASPLELQVASTTCKCTVAGVSENTIPPGAEGKVQLDWTVPGHGRVFRQIATVLTNDPKHKRVDFTIEGLIRTSLGADREEISLLLDPDKSTTTDFTIFSQQWADFSVRSLDTGVTGVDWEESPTDGATLAELKAKSGRTIRVTVAGGKAVKVSDSLRLTIEPRNSEGIAIETESEEGLRLEIPFQVSVRRPLSIYGPAIQSSGLIVLGETQQGVAKQVRMQIKVRDVEPTLPDVRFETFPTFLKADITPHIDRKTGEALPGLYDFIVAVPPDAPPCTYLGDNLGQVRILTSHPRITDTPLGVRFAVLPR